MAGNDKDSPEEIPRLIDPILKKDYHFVQGSRYQSPESTSCRAARTSANVSIPGIRIGGSPVTG